MFSKPLAVKETPIKGVLLYDLPVHGDNRGWFKENWQLEKMSSFGLADFFPVQNNVSFNASVGTTRGIHAEPWDKYVSVGAGRVFGAWVDLREGPGFGTLFTTELDPSKAIFVPRGVGNAFQTLEEGTVYTYLVNDHWSADARDEYTFLNLSDEEVAVPWPIPLERAEISDKDRNHPCLREVRPMKPRQTLVVGAGGQLGTALRNRYRNDSSVRFVGRDELDFESPRSMAAFNWSAYDVVINAAAYTAVDEAQTDAGREKAWTINVSGVAALVEIARRHSLILVHISSDYVFDGRMEKYDEEARPCPLSVYGQTKAAADALVGSLPRHYIIRTSWVVGQGANFVRAMAALAENGASPSVVDDQIGRLTFASELAAGIDHLLECKASFGIYNISSAGPSMSWADIAREVFALKHQDSSRVVGVSTDAYMRGRSAAPRPRNSTLTLHKVRATGFSPRPMLDSLRDYLMDQP